MSFTLSDLTGLYFVSLSGTKGIAASAISGTGLYYSPNSGKNWFQTTTGSVQSGNFAVVLSGTNAIASSGSGTGLYHSTDAGVTWTQASPVSVQSGNFNLASLSGTKAIVSSSGNGLYHSSDSGASWTQSTPASVQTGSFPNVSLSGIYALASSSTNGVYYSTDSGVSWTQTTTVTLQTDEWNISLEGLIGIASNSDLSLGIWYTIDGGQSWTLTSTVSLQTGKWDAYLSGIYGIAGSATNLGIRHSPDSGVTWVSTNITSGQWRISMSGSVGTAVGNGGTTGIWYTTDSGASWTQSNITSGTFFSVSTSGLIGLVGSGAGIYYTSTPICYDKNTLILVLENNEEIYKKISELKVGDLVKTYKNGYKGIKLINSFHYKCLDKGKPLNCLYKMKGHDIIVTGGHSILVDELTEGEKLNNWKYNYNYTIEDKKLLLACSSDKFEKIIDDLEYELYHLVLENDNIYYQYGIYITDGILSETCSEAEFGKKFLIH